MASTLREFEAEHSENRFDLFVRKDEDNPLVASLTLSRVAPSEISLRFSIKAGETHTQFVTRCLNAWQTMLTDLAL